MKSFYRVLRAVLVVVFLSAFIIPATLFIFLSVPGIQKGIKEKSEKELSRMLDSNVGIRDLAFSPFNRVTLFGVTATDAQGDTVVNVQRLGAGISIVDILFTGRLVVNYVEIIGLDSKITRATPTGEYNISNIINALKPKNENRKEIAFDLSVNTIILRNTSMSYDVISEPPPVAHRFNRHHVKIENLRADIALPVISNNVYAADVYRLALEERSGFRLDDLHGRLFFSTDSINVRNLGVRLPASNLLFSDLKLEFDEPGDFAGALKRNAIEFSIDEGSYVTPNDIACFFNPLANLTRPFDLTLKLRGNTEKVMLQPLRLSSRDNSLSLIVQGEAFNILEAEGRSVVLDKTLLTTNGELLSSFLDGVLSDKIRTSISCVGGISYQGYASLDEKELNIDGELRTEAGDAEMKLKAFKNPEQTSLRPFGINADLNLSDVEIGKIISIDKLGMLDARIDASGRIETNGEFLGKSIFGIDRIDYSGHSYSGIEGNVAIDGHQFELDINSDVDSLCLFNLNVACYLPPRGEKSIKLFLDGKDVRPYELGLWKKYPGTSFSAEIEADMHGNTIEDFCGEVSIIDFLMSHDENLRSLDVKEFKLTASGPPSEREIQIRSDLVDLDLNGAFYPLSMKDNLMSMAHSVLPSVVDSEGRHSADPNIFDLNVTLKPTEEYADMLNLPLSLLSDVILQSEMDSEAGDFQLTIDAPYIRQGNKLIENTGMQAEIISGETSRLSFSTKTPTKDGLMTVSLINTAQKDSMQTGIDWNIDRLRTYRGELSFSTIFSKGKENGEAANEKLLTDIHINPGELEFNDTVWMLKPSNVFLIGKEFININNLEAGRTGQHIKIDGNISRHPSDELVIELDDINLDYIFEALGIDKARIGGDATGTFTASMLLTDAPQITTPGLAVKNISYNSTVLGDALVKSGWQKEEGAITLNAEISQPNELKTYIDGAIFPLNDSLDITFTADKVNIGFLKPFMEAFTSDVEGIASGRARLWGNFKYIDLEGRLNADDIRMKIDFTNTWYSASDSVIITPGYIALDNITLRDSYGKTAMLNGYVAHTFFKEPVFEFNITDAGDFLVYDETESRNPKWFGRVFANGSANVKGGPGFVDITCDMTTAPNSVFTFVLTDMEEAGEYTFITYRDRNLLAVKDSLIKVDPTPYWVKRFRERMAMGDVDGLSRYDMDFNIGITPDLQMILVMDPIGGDRIKAYGSGNMRMQYGSTDEELLMYGTYTLDRGDYNFTLQDIIIKDFSIRDGSNIAFRGDPYTAQLDITAVYSLTANISDLDASFLMDRDISRTNVPVHALLKVTGDLQQPDVSFDLEFPTLTQDTYRKVKSIVSTEDMMNRQIIYLLALNRFYTPDYMQSATKGNELMSVASSTLSSQLSNILGQISDKWSISPNIRSERGDFADMEVDLALSSALLNNRLLFNGNFGYRDKSLNNNQFVGDFDIEYLLNRPGTIRLKAYNRYNDRNFYVKSALTTQGVGVMFKHDFDSFFNFFGKKKKDNNEVVEAEMVESENFTPDEEPIETYEEIVEEKK